MNLEKRAQVLPIMCELTTEPTVNLLTVLINIRVKFHAEGWYRLGCWTLIIDFRGKWNKRRN